MGFRSRISSLIVSALIMSIIWQITETGAFRDITGNFGGKVVISILALIVASIVGSLLSGGK